MEWYTILAIFLIIILTIILGIMVACMLSGEQCSILYQRRTPNHELTKIQQEEEMKRKNKLSSKLKRTFHSSSKLDQPISPVEDIKTIELKFNLGSGKKEPEQIATIHELSRDLLPPTRNTEAERRERQKKREELRKKYNL